MNFKRITAAIIAFIMLTTALASCSAKRASTPEEAVEGFLKYFSAQKFSKAFDYVEEYDGFSYDDRNESDSKKIIKAVAKTLTYTVNGRTESETPVEVTATVTCVDLTKVYQNCTEQLVNDMMSDVLGGEEIDSDKFKAKLNDAVIEAIAAENAPICTSELTFKLEDTDDGWLIIMDDLIYNGVCGNIKTANDWLYNRMINSGEALEQQEEQAEAETETGESTSVDQAAE